MNIEELAAKITIFLTPFMPYLVSGGKGAASELGEHFGNLAIERAKSLWVRLKPASDEQRAFKDASAALASNPQSFQPQLAMTKALTAYLTQNPIEVQAILALISESKVVQSILVDREAEVKEVLQEIGSDGMSGNSLQEGVIKGKVEKFIQKR